MEARRFIPRFCKKRFDGTNSVKHKTLSIENAVPDSLTEFCMNKKYE